MTDKREANVGQLRLVKGSRMEHPANLGIAERSSFLPISGRGKGRLYILVELSGGPLGREELCQDLVNAIAEEYFHTPGTVTYGLRQSILLANTLLLRANARISSEHRVGGTACVVLRGGEAFIAQAGWPVVYLIHREHVQAFPDTTLQDQDTSMIGQRQTTEVRLFRAPVQSGDTILMVDGPMARQLGITRIGQIVSGGIEQATRNLETLAPPEDCTAMVILLGLSPSQARAQAEQWTFMPVEQPPTPEEELPAEPGRSFPPLPSQEISYPVPVEEIAETFEAPHEEPAATVSTTGDRIGEIFGAVGNGVRALGERILPDRQLERATSQRRRRAARARRDRGQQVRRTNWGLATVLAIPLVALLVVVGYTMYRNWSLQSQYKTYLETATLKRDIAISSAESPAVARDYWLQVLTNLQAADGLQPNQPEVVQMRTQAEVEIDRIDGVTRLGQAYKVYEYDMPGSAPSRIVVAGLDVYVLDRGTDRVYHHTLNEVRNALRNPDDDQVLIQQGQPIEGNTVGRPVDISWTKDGGERQAGALLILDRNGLLLEYDPSWEQLDYQLVGGQDMWRNPLALRTYDSNLYILDPMINQILKYWSQQYSNAPDRWIKQDDVDLTTAIDLGIDGNIYVLHSNGTLTKYYGGQPTPFTLTRMPKPLTGGDALYVDIEEVTQYIYVIDASEQRIVQLDREGTFVRQFQPALGQEESFRQLSGIFVDEAGAKLYYVAANALYVTDIPPVQP